MAPQLLLMGATFLVMSGCNAAAYAMLSGGLARVLDAAARRVVHRMGAVSLMGMGVLTATLRRA
jgi:threonine/homoserine/homoserine lactone efflux protein